MNTDVIGGNWEQLKGRVRETWGKLTDDDLDVIAGRRDRLLGKVQERYGRPKEDIQHGIANFERSVHAKK
jgi:uncharacterized protein YjbJ (UPF0337 family)